MRHLNRWCSALFLSATSLWAGRETNRFVRTDNPAGGIVITADIEVAFEPVPTALATQISNPRLFLETTMQKASEKLFNASSGSVQLGDVKIRSKEMSGNPDILVTTACKSTKPSQGMVGSGSRVCADAHTGGYVGIQWWLPLASAVPGAERFAFLSSTAKGARITVDWQSLYDFSSTVSPDNGASILIHEFGHYLFGMRDEYEGGYYPDQDAYFGVTTWKDPTLTPGGSALAGMMNTSDIYCNVWAMGAYDRNSADKVYSPETYPTTCPQSGGNIQSSNVPNPGDPAETGFGALEQITTLATKATGATSAKGAMWSLAAAIRTSLCAYDNTQCAALIPTNTSYNPALTSVEALDDFEGKVVVFDRSGSMETQLPGSTYSRWDAAVNALGWFTSKDWAPTTKFGFVAFDDEIEPVETYAVQKSELAKYTTLQTIGQTQIWVSSTTNPVPVPRGLTNLVGGLELARNWLHDFTKGRPAYRDVILLSDGEHNHPYGSVFTGDEGKDGKYRVFVLSIANDPSDLNNPYAQKMTQLASRSGGKVYYTEDMGSCQAAMDDIINYSNAALTTTSNATLWSDRAMEITSKVDAGMKKLSFTITWNSESVPKLALQLPNNGGIVTEVSSVPGITFTSKGFLKTFSVDMTKNPVGEYKLIVTSTDTKPIDVKRAIAIENSSLGVAMTYGSDALNANGALPVQVVVQDGTPIKGLHVTATLRNSTTGVVKTMPLTFNGVNYSGTFSGQLPAGPSTLTANIVHPNNGEVFAVGGENSSPTNLPPQYAFFQPRSISQEVFISGSTPVFNGGLVAYTMQEQPTFSQGTRLKLFLRNNGSLNWTGLKARYFFSVSEVANTSGAFTPMWLAGNSRVTVAPVTGRPGLWYAEFAFEGKTLRPGDSTSLGSKGGEGIIVRMSDWNLNWDPSNDYSFNGLSTNWAENSFINIYDNSGKLLVGNPDLDPPTSAAPGNASPVVSMELIGSDLIVQNQNVFFSGNSYDPDGDQMSYAWQVSPSIGSTSTSEYLGAVFPNPGNYQVTFKATDIPSGAWTSVSKSVYVQPSFGACTESNTTNLGAINSNQVVALGSGVNCFKIQGSNIVREWPWGLIQFQVNSENGVNLTGIGVEKLGGSTTNLSGYSQSIGFADPGRDNNLYLRLIASTPRTVRLNWWLQ